MIATTATISPIDNRGLTANQPMAITTIPTTKAITNEIKPVPKAINEPMNGITSPITLNIRKIDANPTNSPKIPAARMIQVSTTLSA